MIGRVALHAVALAVGIATGGVLVLATAPAPAATPSPPTRPAPVASEVKAAPLPRSPGSVLLAWTPGRLSSGLRDGAASVDGLTDRTVVRAGRLDLTASHTADGTAVDELEDGWRIPLDAVAIDPGTFEGFAPTAERPVLRRLEPGSILLGATSAGLRGIGVGGRLTVAPGGAHTVVGVVDDAVVGAAEVVLHVDDPAAAGFEPRYLLVRHEGDRASVESALRSVAGDRPLRVRAPGETPFLRHGDAVLPQAILKAHYGEFAYRPPRPGTLAFEPDPVWVETNVATGTVPILGAVTCHRSVLPVLAAALTEIDRRGLAHTIDRDGFAGCWNPRLIAADGDLSRHAWGVAVDLNADGNPTGTGSGQHPELVDVLTSHGWGWGGTWLIPDPMHFELVDPTPTVAIKTRP